MNAKQPQNTTQPQLETQPQRTLALWVIAVVLVIVSAVLAQDKLYDLFLAPPGPFDISHSACQKRDNNWCLSSSRPGQTVRERIAIFGFDEEIVLKANGWERHMLNVEVPVNRYFKLAILKGDEKK